MQRLTALTLGALAIGLAGIAYDAASAQTPAASACTTHEASIYFAPESSDLNAYADYAIDRMAEAAQSCGAKGVVIQASTEGDRAKNVATALRHRGLKAVIIPAPALAFSGDTMMARSVTLRVAAPGNSQS